MAFIITFSSPLVKLNYHLVLITTQAGFDLFDFSLLPAFDAVRKYFGLSEFYARYTFLPALTLNNLVF